MVKKIKKVKLVKYKWKKCKEISKYTRKVKHECRNKNIDKKTTNKKLFRKQLTVCLKDNKKYWKVVLKIKY